MASANGDKMTAETARSGAGTSTAATTSSYPVQNPRKSSRKAAKPADKTAWLTKGTGEMLKTFEQIELEASSSEVTSTAGFDLLCTYNWSLGKVPSIYVPVKAAPPLWTPVELPKTLPKDSGTHFVDQNAAKMPTYPFEPVFGALSIMNPTFDFNDVDIVANRNSFRKLLDFSRGRVPDSFRIDLNMLKNTLFLTRRERNNRQIIYGSQNSGVGHNFEQAFTQPEAGIEDSSAHHRVIRYKLGELDCVVRFEVDAWCQGEGDSSEAELAKFENSSLHEDILPGASFASLSLNDANNKTPGQYQPTRTIPRGHLVPSSRIAEVKARSGVANLQQMIPQLWFGRTPHLFIGSHKKGTFSGVRSINMMARFPDWEKTQQDVLRKMARLIAELRETARAAEGGACVAVCDKKVRPFRLNVFASKGKTSVLPDNLVRQYWRRGESS
ncbi:hypothetical protein MMC13_004226 [Lambiella insularis]|nr:hypothetical protein [Lambiella insularis]